MCMNCGCGELDERHKASDITASDVREAAAGKPLDQTVRNLRTSLDQMEQSGGQMAGSQGGSSREDQYAR
jgi:hypothetical protein